MTRSLWNILLAALMLSLTACSTDDDLRHLVDDGRPTGDAPAAGSVVINLQLVAPQGAMVTRAVNDHGTVEEYAVNDGILVLFKANSGQTEADAKVWQAYDISETFKDDPMNSITQSTHISKALTVDNSDPLDESKLRSGDKLFAFVMLNVQGQFSVAANILQDEASNPLTGKTLANLQAMTTKLGDATHGYFMSNAPLKDISTGLIATLVEVSNVFITENQAKNSDAKPLMVERACAKVTAANAVSTDAVVVDYMTGISIDDNNKDMLKVHDVQWTVKHYNTTSPLVRTYEKPADCGGNDLVDYDNTINNQQRTMWAVNDGATPTNTGTFQPLTTPFYVGEHTVASEAEAKTKGTKAVFKISFKDASNVICGTLYAYNDADADYQKRVFTSEAKLKKYVTEVKSDSYDAAKLITFPGSTMYFETPICHLWTTPDLATTYIKYGVVRDNVYDITLKSIAKIGSATP